METVKKHPDRVAILYEDVKWTFTQLDEYSNKVANCFVAMNFHPGQEVALFMESRPEFIGIWLGLAKAGLVTSLINTNLRRNTLVHSISVVNCKAVIFSSDLADGKFRFSIYNLLILLLSSLKTAIEKRILVCQGKLAIYL